MPASPLSTRYRNAFVTGASSGLGRAFAEMLLAEGVHVWGTSRDLERLQRFAGTANFHGVRFHPVRLDLADSAGAAAAFAGATAEAGGFDLVVNNAGFGEYSPFSDADFAVWQAQFDSMIGATARLAHAALREMTPRNHGCLVNVSSVAVDFPIPFMSGYNATKAALTALSESLIFETRSTGVSVLDFRPADYRTPFNQAMQPTSRKAGADPRLERAWRTLEANLEAAPPAARAARDLRRALRRGRSGTVRSGSFFQARLAPWLARFAPAGLRRAISARYFGAA